ALAQYEACRHVLAAELEVEPSNETAALYEQIRAGEIVPVSQLGAKEVAGKRGGPIAAVSAAPDEPAGLQNDGEVPQIGSFYRRDSELAIFGPWLNDERRPRVILCG